MPFIEDSNGLAIYFTREEWEVILDELAESLEIYEHWKKEGMVRETTTPFDNMLADIVSRIRKHVR